MSTLNVIYMRKDVQAGPLVPSTKYFVVEKFTCKQILCFLFNRGYANLYYILPCKNRYISNSNTKFILGLIYLIEKLHDISLFTRGKHYDISLNKDSRCGICIILHKNLQTRAVKYFKGLQIRFPRSF